MASQYETYNYSPLRNPGSIRAVDAGRVRIENGIVTCELVEIVVGAEPCPKYHCLSYTWGNPFEDDNPGAVDTFSNSKRKSIMIKSPGNGGYVSITSNLHDFLWEFATNCSNVEHIWIDAICINQTDLNELSSQVSMMGQVYSSCEAVLVWLGPQGSETSTLYSIASTVGNVPEKDFEAAMDATKKKCRELNLPYIPVSQVLEHLGIELFSDDQWQACMIFLKRRWFYRAWSLQECIVPRQGEFWCGTFRISIRHVSRLATLCKAHVEENFEVMSDDGAVPWTATMHTQLNAIWNGRLQMALTGEKLKFIPPWWRATSSSNPRDKIYGFLGLVDSSISIEVDYKKSIQQVYMEYSLQLPLKALLWHVEDPSTRVTKGLPSWAPDYFVPCQPLTWISNAGWFYRAGGEVNHDFKPLYPLSIDSQVLSVPGFETDTVAYTGASYTDMTEGDGLLVCLTMLWELVARGWPREESPVEAFWRTLIADLRGNGPGHPVTQEMGPSFRNAALYLIATFMTKTQPSAPQRLSIRTVIESLREHDTGDSLPLWTEINQLVAEMSKGQGHANEHVCQVGEGMKSYMCSLGRLFPCRRFFITTSGRLGVGPISIDVGDGIFILESIEFPFVLGKTESGGSRLIGHAYVRGIMYGEALAGHDFRCIEIE